MDVLDARSERLASDLLAFAFASPQGPTLKRRPRQGVAARTVRWPPQLDLALTFACMIDLAGEGRLSIDASGSLVVIDVAPTGSPAHDLLLRRVAGAGSGAPPRSWVWRLRREVANAVLADAVIRGELAAEDRPRHRGPAAHGPAVRAGVDELHAEVRRVMRGESHDPRATALFILCAATPLRELLPSERDSILSQRLGRSGVALQVVYLFGGEGRAPGRRSLSRRIEQLPPSAVADAFGPGAARLGISTVAGVSALIPKVTWVTSGGGG